MSGHHIVPLKTNLITLIVLLFLTAFTVFSATQWHFGGALNLILAMCIASVKAFIVFSWFMHLKYDNKLNRAIAVGGILFLGLFVGFAYVDLFYR